MENREYKILTVEDIAGLNAKVNQIEKHLAFLCSCYKMSQVINISDIARIMQVSRTQLLTKQRYLLPHYGRISDFPDGPMRWRYSTWEAWDSRPVELRKQEYEALLLNEKNKYRRGR